MKAFLGIDTEKMIDTIDPRIYSSFIEHMGRAVYTGIYEPEHPAADGEGFRDDVADHIRRLNISNIRYPGGNFLSGYRWEDGIGPKNQRPVRRELAWFSLEPNYVGINEFVTYCRSVGAEPMIGVNLGTRGAQEAADLVEYCNVPGGTYWSDLRRSHGYEKAHNIKLWCLGNEMDGPWQICAKTAEEYGRLACETAKMMKWTDDSIELVACGSSCHSMPTFGKWERTVLHQCWDYIDYLSLHQYYQNLDGDIPTFLARSVEMDSFIKEVADICAEEKACHSSSHQVKLSFDEWNVWYHFQKDCVPPPKWIFPRPIEEETYDFADALLVGTMLNTLIKNSDSVKIACLAQLVNVIAPIMTEPRGKSWLQTIYYPFYYASRYGRGTALQVDVKSSTYTCKLGEIPCLDAAAILSSEMNSVAVFLVNRFGEMMNLSAAFTDKNIDKVHKAVRLEAPLNAINNKDNTAVIPCNNVDYEFSGNTIQCQLPPFSWTMLLLGLQ